MRWIVDEVDDLVASGVLSSESAAALRRHYEQQLAQEETGGRVVLLSVLGATLIGAGILLIIAHNWDDLGRPARTALSLLPLVVSLAISLWTLLKRAGSTAWREGAGVAHCAGVAASIALVSQTYHISGELSDFLFTWLLLIVPLPYLLGAIMPALVYLAGVAFWAGTTLDGNGSPDGYWLFLAAILPFYAGVLQRDRLGKAAAWLSACVGLSAAFGLGFQYAHADGVKAAHGLWIPAFSGFFGVLYFSGVCGFSERRYHPLRVLGALGIVGLTVLLSFKGIWPQAGFWGQSPQTRWLDNGLAIAFPLAALGLAARAFVHNVNFNRVAAGLPLAVLAAYGLAAAWNPAAAAILINLYGLALALGSAFRGLQQRAVVTLNGGLLLLAALLVSRFVDSDFGTVERGLAFVVLGGLVLGANLWMLKTKREGRA